MPARSTTFDLPTAYDAYSRDPSPVNASLLLDQLQPTLERGIWSFARDSKSPLMMSHARRIALDSLRTYDSKKSDLKTHVTNHLRGLQRIGARRTQAVSVPERTQLARQQMYKAEQEIEQQLGRLPSTQELADSTGLSRSRIEYLRRHQSGVPASAFQDTETGGPFSPAVQQSDPHRLRLELLYADLSPINQAILEWTLGLHGNQPASNQEIARRLKLTPGAITQRKMAIQRMLDRTADMEF